MEELLARIYELESPKNRRLTEEEIVLMKQVDGGARYYAKVRGLLT